MCSSDLVFLYFDLGSGSSQQTAASSSWQAVSTLGVTGATSVVGTNGATFYITGVQLEKGATATPFENRLYGAELALCQRYYRQASAEATGNNSEGSVYGYGTGGTTVGQAIPYPVSMRSAPTIAYAGTWSTVNCTTSIASGTTSYLPYITLSGSGNAYHVSSITGYMTFAAEL